MSHETKGQHQTDADGQRGEGDSESLTLVESLMDERRKFEHWLAALEARRSATPERVFTRVHADYHDRLDSVVEQLKEHTEGLRAELAVAHPAPHGDRGGAAAAARRARRGGAARSRG